MVLIKIQFDTDIALILALIWTNGPDLDLNILIMIRTNGPGLDPNSLKTDMDQWSLSISEQFDTDTD